MQPFFRKGIKNPIDIVEDSFHVFCSYFLDLHNLTSALWHP